MAGADVFHAMEWRCIGELYNGIPCALAGLRPEPEYAGAIDAGQAASRIDLRNRADVSFAGAFE